MPSPQAFDLPDGARTAVEWFGAPGAPKGLVVLLPALGVNVSYYRPLATAWAQLGYQIALVELRGGQQSSVRDVRRHDFGYREVLTQDLPALVPALCAQAGVQRCWLAGHSLGGQFALLYASQHPDACRGVALLAGGSNCYTTAPKKKRVQRYLGVRLVRLITRLLGYFPGHRLGFAGRQPRGMMLDWSHEALFGRYQVRGDATDYEAALGRLPLPVLLVSLRGDPLVSKDGADFLAAKLGRARVTQVELTDRRYDHFRWVKDPATVLGPVDAWVSAS